MQSEISREKEINVESPGDVLLQPIIAAAGTDISHWFDPDTGNVKYHVDKQTQCYVPYTPDGRFIHVPPPYPTTDWATDFGLPWWKNKLYVIGKLTSCPRKIRIINTLVSTEDELEVCNEETLLDILTRYLEFNKHAASYTWKYHNRVLDMEKSLEENGVKLEDPEIEDQFPPHIYLYFNDDLTEA